MFTTMPKTTQAPIYISRTLTQEQWIAIANLLDSEVQERRYELNNSGNEATPEEIASEEAHLGTLHDALTTIDACVGAERQRQSEACMARLLGRHGNWPLPSNPEGRDRLQPDFLNHA